MDRSPNQGPQGQTIVLFVTALVTILLELTLIRVFDVQWYSNMSYMVITLAMFSLGLAGVYNALFPVKDEQSARRRVSVSLFFLGVTGAVILPIMNTLPFNFHFLDAPLRQSISAFLIIYVSLALPFFFAGMIFSTIFSEYPGQMQRLYFWDLTGAAIGAVVILPLIPVLGPGGLLMLAATLSLLVLAYWLGKGWSRHVLVVAALAVLALPAVQAVYPFAGKSSYLDFYPHLDKRGYKLSSSRGQIEYTRWDPISKIDIVNQTRSTDTPNTPKRALWIAYDGGTQSSFFYPFDGDFKKLENEYLGRTPYHFWGRIVFVAEYLKKNTNQDVLVIGGAGGQETKAALLFGARSVDTIELVGTVVDLGKTLYNDFIGGIYTNPKVNAQQGEGRTFLRSTDKKYDIIQIMSNHTSSSIASGTGAMATVYLQTKEAYMEYFGHLKKDGVLQVNHHIYPREITTAALAWKAMGRKDFQKYVIALESTGVRDTLPTLLIKMIPWTAEEVRVAQTLLSTKRLVIDPIHPDKSTLPPVFFSGDFPEKLADSLPVRLMPATDDRPYFNFIRKSFSKLELNPSKFVNISIAWLINSQLQRGIPMDVVHLLATAIAAGVFAIVFIFVPLLFSKVGRSSWRGKFSVLSYFACLGIGFIIFELVFIQKFMKLVGYPLYTYTVVVFGFLSSAGIGSYASEKMRMADISSSNKRWLLAFVGIILWSAVLQVFGSGWFEVFMAMPIWVRMLAAYVMIIPLGFCLGMPFPLGIVAIKDLGPAAVAWSWAMNALFTVVGGLASVLASIYWGFNLTLLIGVAAYVLAALLLGRIRSLPATPV